MNLLQYQTKSDMIEIIMTERNEKRQCNHSVLAMCHCIDISKTGSDENE